MSRAINFQISEDKSFTDKELQRLYNLSSYYSKNFDWIVDEFWAGINPPEPNWKKFQDDSLGWAMLEDHLKSGLNEQKSMIEVLREGEELGIVENNPPLDTNVFESTVRVLGNEACARVILKALSDVSLAIPNCTIKAQDEGHLLYCDLIIRKGKAIPDTAWLKGLKSDLVSMATVKYGDVDSRVKDPSVFKYYKEDMNLRVKSFSEILQKLSKKIGTKKIESKYIQYITESNWPDMEFFLRNVDIRSFNHYKASPGNLLGGYFGEHWNLTNIDVESESYHFLSKIQKNGKGKDYELVKVF